MELDELKARLMSAAEVPLKNWLNKIEIIYPDYIKASKSMQYNEYTTKEYFYHKNPISLEIQDYWDFYESLYDTAQNIVTPLVLNILNAQNHSEFIIEQAIKYFVTQVYINFDLTKESRKIIDRFKT